MDERLVVPRKRQVDQCGTFLPLSTNKGTVCEENQRKEKKVKATNDRPFDIYSSSVVACLADWLFVVLDYERA